MPHLYIIRGLPGSGKSTYAKNMYNHDIMHYEADDFFMDRDGGYKYVPALIGAAHDWCYGNTVLALKNGYDVIVSNTFTKMWELEKYLGIRVIVPDVTISVIEMRTQYGSIHGVPDEIIQKMKSRWEDIPKEYLDGGLFVKVVE